MSAVSVLMAMWVAKYQPTRMVNATAATATTGASRHTQPTQWTRKFR